MYLSLFLYPPTLSLSLSLFPFYRLVLNIPVLLITQPALNP